MSAHWWECRSANRRYHRRPRLTWFAWYFGPGFEPRGTSANGGSLMKAVTVPRVVATALISEVGESSHYQVVVNGYVVGDADFGKGQGLAIRPWR